jgi:hypothetical protein
MLSSDQETEPACQTLQDRPPFASLMNVAPSPADEHRASAVDKTTTIKMMKLRLPHPKKPRRPPLPHQQMERYYTHPIKGWMYGFFGYHIFYKHFYFHDGRVLHTKAFAPSTTATTVGDCSNPRGSTELDEETGHNCTMSQDEYNIFTLLVLGLRPDKNHGTKRSESSFINMLLEDFVSLPNLTAVFALNKPTDRKMLARILTRFVILLLGADALTPSIIQTVWGENDVVRRNLGGPRGDLAIIRRRLISHACVANNVLHLWLTTTFNGHTIIPPDSLKYIPPGAHNILQLVRHDDASIYVREPHQSGQDRICILLRNLRQHPTNPISSNFDDIVISWFRDLICNEDCSTDTTGVENHIFAVFGLCTST